ncbi:FeoB-associated Cys-rich membrane protein [Clostridium sp. SM-530-WT-3G]|uniref:FeoB-associated Cys-rich membrane protein n=1 Tax=Clostridium sp. SM-530-WT-3G TaxID=2725303 RepID=UPI00145E2441|nr:FeoB-associated Cys-rich membrane protein [Clostridium sp. SM-530-WT-3G]NME83852.1 FeoB-associated Cys-rich membrane protein [Clostridium sp. SM-530-WT-3G]
MEILIAGLILIFAIWIIAKSLKKSSEGKCSGGCSGCSQKNQCNSNNNIIIK